VCHSKLNSDVLSAFGQSALAGSESAVLPRPFEGLQYEKCKNARACCVWMTRGPASWRAWYYIFPQGLRGSYRFERWMRVWKSTQESRAAPAVVISEHAHAGLWTGAPVSAPRAGPSIPDATRILLTGEPGRDASNQLR